MAKIKLCGMTNLEDCQVAVDLGADFVGFVFYKQSRRCVTAEQVRAITERIAGKVKTVGVFVEETDDEIAAIMEFCALDFCQVYRQSSLARRITAYRVKDGFSDAAVSEGLILLDSFSDGFGGSGRAFGLDLIKGAGCVNRAFIAGGISEDNVSGVLALNPFGVDLVTAVEASPGRKDHGKMETFVRKVRSCTI